MQDNEEEKDASTAESNVGTGLQEERKRERALGGRGREVEREKWEEIVHQINHGR